MLLSSTTHNTHPTSNPRVPSACTIPGVSRFLSQSNIRRYPCFRYAYPPVLVSAGLRKYCSCGFRIAQARSVIRLYSVSVAHFQSSIVTNWTWFFRFFRVVAFVHGWLRLVCPDGEEVLCITYTLAKCVNTRFIKMIYTYLLHTIQL